MKKYLFILIFLIGCSEEEDAPVKLSNYDKTDPELRYLLKSYISDLTFYDNVVHNFYDTSKIVLKYVSEPYNGTNLTEISTEDGITTITFHKAFFDPWEGRGYDLKMPYLIHVIQQKDWECIGPWRELKTQKDLDGFVLMFDQGFKIKPTGGDWRLLKGGDMFAVWFSKVIQEYQSAEFDYTDLETAYSQNSIPICNK